MQAGEAHLNSEQDLSNRLEGNSRNGQPSHTTIAHGSFSRIISIPTPYGPIGLTVPASFPPAAEARLVDGLKRCFQDSTSTGEEDS